jgi:DNA-binding MarR family transcriptional regulator
VEEAAPTRGPGADKSRRESEMDELTFQETLREEIYKVIARDIGEQDSRFKKTPHALEEFDVEHLTNEEAELLFALEGEKSLAKVSQDLGWSPINVARVLFGLISMDLVERTDEQ